MTDRQDIKEQQSDRQAEFILGLAQAIGYSLQPSEYKKLTPKERESFMLEAQDRTKEVKGEVIA